MRLIKFRAWHKKWNFMFNINQIDWDKKLIWSEDMPVFSTHSGWEIKDGLSCINHEKKTVRLGWCPFDLVKSLDQFTGLFDKNGKEIYEGDFIRAKDEMSDHIIEGTVLYFDNLAYFAVEFFDGEQMGHLRFNDLHKDSIEVIGTIYKK